MHLNSSQAARFIYRATYGPREGMNDIHQLVNAGTDVWFNEQRHERSTSLLQQSQHFADLRGSGHNYLTFYGAYWHKVCNDQDQLRQRMAYALSQILVVSVKSGDRYDQAADYYDKLSRHALGSYRDLLYEVTRDRLMGRYLSLRNSRKHDSKKNSFPDENYARELMQLFTLGLYTERRGVKTPTYTHEDVQEMARVLTGWTSYGTSGLSPMIAREDWHDRGEKHVLGHHFPAGQSAEQDLTQALDIVFQHPATAQHISKQLIQRLVTSNPRRAYIKRVAKVFSDNGQGVRGDLFAVAKAILTDKDAIEGFGANDNGLGGRKRKNFGKVKEPWIAMANLFRALGVTSHQQAWTDFNTITNLGQAVLKAPSVFNFYKPTDAPSGEISDLDLVAPEFTILDMTTMNLIANKFNHFIWADHERGATGERSTNWDSASFRRLARNGEALINKIDEHLFAGLMSDRLKSHLMKLHQNYRSVGYHTDQNTVYFMLYTAQNSPEFRCEV